MKIVELTLILHLEHHGIKRTPISFLIVDLDLDDFAGEKKKGKAVLERVLNETLQKTR